MSTKAYSLTVAGYADNTAKMFRKPSVPREPLVHIHGFTDGEYFSFSFDPADAENFIWAIADAAQAARSKNRNREKRIEMKFKATGSPDE